MGNGRGSLVRRKEPRGETRGNPPWGPRFFSSEEALGALFTFSNALLSYAPLGLSAKLWAFLFGVLLPFGLAAWSLKPAGGKEAAFPAPEPFPPPSRPLWLLVLGLGTCVRLAQVFLPGAWPTWDDGRFAYYSVELLDHWRWVFFFSPTQHPPFFNWLLALFYRLVPPSLTALWLYPALYSIAALLLIGVAARKLFPPFLAFLLTFLMAFNFWPLYAGRFCMYMATLVFWECLTLAVLAFWMRSPGGRGKNLWLAALGGCVAGGFWVSISWPVVALAFVVGVCAALRRGKRLTLSTLAVFLGPVFLSALLFAGVSLALRNGVHVRFLWAWAGEVDGWRQLLDSASNLTVLFWGCDLQNGYGPVQGGVLNPLEGACFFLGLLECWRLRRNPLTWGLGAAFLVLLLPGMATKNFDLFRNTQVIPVLLLLAALGARRLFLSLPARGKYWIAVPAALLCAFLDGSQVLRTYSFESTGSNRPSSPQLAKAFPLLRAQARQQGPGALLFEVRSHESDQTLAVATYGFNATVNPHIAPDQVRWMALVTDVHYRPFLQARFPDSTWWNLYDEARPDRGGVNLALGVIPLDPGRRELLETWRLADGKLRPIIWKNENLPEDDSRKVIPGELSEVRPFFQGDPFLESVYWEAVFSFHRWENLFGDKDAAVHLPAALQAVREELDLGYPTAVFYNEWGSFLAMRKDEAGARKAFLSAVHCPVDLTFAAENLKDLDAAKQSPAGGK